MPRGTAIIVEYSEYLKGLNVEALIRNPNSTLTDKDVIKGIKASVSKNKALVGIFAGKIDALSKELEAAKSQSQKQLLEKEEAHAEERRRDALAIDKLEQRLALATDVSKAIDDQRREFKRDIIEKIDPLFDVQRSSGEEQKTTIAKFIDDFKSSKEAWEEASRGANNWEQVRLDLEQKHFEVRKEIEETYEKRSAHSAYELNLERQRVIELQEEIGQYKELRRKDKERINDLKKELKALKEDAKKDEYSDLRSFIQEEFKSQRATPCTSGPTSPQGVNRDTSKSPKVSPKASPKASPQEEDEVFNAFFKETFNLGKPTDRYPWQDVKAHLEAYKSKYNLKVPTMTRDNFKALMTRNGYSFTTIRGVPTACGYILK